MIRPRLKYNRFGWWFGTAPYPSRLCLWWGPYNQAFSARMAAWRAGQREPDLGRIRGGLVRIPAGPPNVRIERL